CGCELWKGCSACLRELSFVIHLVIFFHACFTSCYIAVAGSLFFSSDNGVWRSLCDLHSAGCIIGTIALACSLFAYAQGNILHEEEGRPSSSGGHLAKLYLLGCCSECSRNPLDGVRLIAAIVVALFPFVLWLYIYVNKEMRASWPTHCKTVI
uniref:Transmembrane protein 220 n=1 Tax=Buteo japonicus TaxID=224669 RepID=A0A8B9YYV5_9AVES